VGVLATVAIVLLVVGYNLLRGKNFFSKEINYYVRYDDAGGIAPAGQVMYKGMNVGQVSGITLANDNSGKIVVAIAVNRDLKIPLGTTATVVNPDIISAKAIQLNFTDSLVYYQKNDTITAGIGRNGFHGVQSQAEALIASLDSALQSVTSVFNSETKKNLRKSIESIAGTLSNVNQSTSKVDAMLHNNVNRLDRIFANVESITSNLNSNQEQVNVILHNLEVVTDSSQRNKINETIDQAQQSLKEVSEVMNKISEGEGSMGLLLNDEKLYRNLETSSKSLDALLVDLKAHPGRYLQFSVFGKKDKSLKDSIGK
jgi:phospholipid/cholesterol/gamma-HCH transport system substrate-binding protein